MVAAPRALGMLRDVYSSAVRMAIRAEVERISSSFPVHEVEEHLLSAMQPRASDESTGGILQLDVDQKATGDSRLFFRPNRNGACHESQGRDDISRHIGRAGCFDLASRSHHAAAPHQWSASNRQGR